MQYDMHSLSALNPQTECILLEKRPNTFLFTVWFYVHPTFLAGPELLLSFIFVQSQLKCNKEERLRKLHELMDRKSAVPQRPKTEAKNFSSWKLLSALCSCLVVVVSA